MKQIAIIPARGGSKRLPRKNILPINGRPIIGYPIRTALESGLFDDVIVSTEDEEIARIAESFGVTIIKRPQSLATDASSVVEVCTHVLGLPEYLEVQNFCCIYATAVFLEPCQLVVARKNLDDVDIDYVMGVSHYDYHPVQALRHEGHYLVSMWPEYQKKKSQEYPELVVSNGTFYWARTKQFLLDQTFYGKRLVGYVLASVDIDTIEDYNNAQEIAQRKNLGSK